MKHYLFLLLIAVSTITFSQICTKTDRDIFEKKITDILARKAEFKTTGALAGYIARGFLNVPYTAHSLEKDGDENLVVNLSELDCTTFLESVTALTLTAMDSSHTFENYCRQLTRIRYRNGIMNSYASRLHYFSDWIFNNTRKGFVDDVTRVIAGEPITFKVNFMTSHPESYKQLTNNPNFIDSMKIYETEISSRKYYYIPKDKVNKIEDLIQEGDLIAITTNIPGMDIGHVGFAVREKDNSTHFLHAPLVGSKVQISPENLSEYLKKIKKHTGIIVLRLK